MPSVSAALRVDLLPGLGRCVDLVGAVVEEAGVGLVRDAPHLVLVGGGGERGRDEVVLAALDVRRQVVEPLLDGELGRPDDVGVEDVALGGLRLLARDELVALLVGGLGELDELGGDAVVLGVERLDRLRSWTRSCPCRAERDLALGGVHRGRVDHLGALDGRPGVASAPPRRRCLVFAAAGGDQQRDDEQREPRAAMGHVASSHDETTCRRRATPAPARPCGRSTPRARARRPARRRARRSTRPARRARARSARVAPAPGSTASRSVRGASSRRGSRTPTPGPVRARGVLGHVAARGADDDRAAARERAHERAVAAVGDDQVAGGHRPRVGQPGHEHGVRRAPRPAAIRRAAVVGGDHPHGRAGQAGERRAQQRVPGVLRRRRRHEHDRGRCPAAARRARPAAPTAAARRRAATAPSGADTRAAAACPRA